MNRWVWVSQVSSGLKHLHQDADPFQSYKSRSGGGGLGGRAKTGLKGPAGEHGTALQQREDITQQGAEKQRRGMSVFRMDCASWLDPAQSALLSGSSAVVRHAPDLAGRLVPPSAPVMVI